MNSHKNARLTLEGRKLLVELIAQMGLIPAALTEGISPRTARRWLERFQESGVHGVYDLQLSRGQDAHEPGLRVAQAHRAAAPRTHAHAMHRCHRRAQRLHCMPVARASRAVQPECPRSHRAHHLYEQDAPSVLLNIDTKKLGRVERPSHRVTGDRRDSTDAAGWKFVHVSIDAHPRVSFVQMHANERKDSAVSFLRAAVAHYEARGVMIKRLITDNGSAYRSRVFANTCQALGIKHTFTRPYRRQTNGKAERFIETCLRERAYRII